MGHYLIEFRFSGSAKRYVKELIFEISRKFKVRGITRKRVVPHLTLICPFRLKSWIWPFSIFLNSNGRRLIKEFNDVVGHYGLMTFKIKNFGNFPENNVLFVNIDPSKELCDMQRELANKLKPFCKLSKFDFDFKPHATIAFKDVGKKFNSIWGYIKNKHPPHINQYLIRVTLIKNHFILCEYDFLQKRMLSRAEAKNKLIFKRTINLLRERIQHN